MINQTIEGLIELGLAEKEAQLYSAALKSGPTTAQNLAIDSGLKRATVYGCIETLISKGFLHTEITGVRKLFIASAPEKLTAMLEKKKQLLTHIMPQLMQDYLHSSPKENNIKIYHGLAGIKLIYDDILTPLKAGDEYLVISDQDKWHALDPAYFDTFIARRAKLGLNTRLILQDSVHARSFLGREAQLGVAVKLLPKHVQMNTNMVIVGDRVLITQTVEPVLAILIENKNVAGMNRCLFEVVWGLT